MVKLRRRNQAVDMHPRTFLHDLLASIRAYRHRREEGMNEAEMSRRLQELLWAPESKQVETSSTGDSRSEKHREDPGRGGTAT